MVHVEGNGGAEGGREWFSVAAARIVGFDWTVLRDRDLVVHCWTREAVVGVPEGFRAFEGHMEREEMQSKGEGEGKRDDTDAGAEMGVGPRNV